MQACARPDKWYPAEPVLEAKFLTASSVLFLLCRDPLPLLGLDRKGEYRLGVLYDILKD